MRQRFILDASCGGSISFRPQQTRGCAAVSNDTDHPVPPAPLRQGTSEDMHEESVKFKLDSAARGGGGDRTRSRYIVIESEQHE